MGSGGIAFSEGSPCLQQDKLHCDKNATKQAFPKESGFVWSNHQSYLVAGKLRHE